MRAMALLLSLSIHVVGTAYAGLICVGFGCRYYDRQVCAPDECPTG